MVRHEDSGRYYARSRVNGKLIWRSPGTTNFSAAKAKLPTTLAERRLAIARSCENDRFANKSEPRSEATFVVNRGSGKLRYRRLLQ